MEYKEYLKTEHWKSLRERFLNSKRFSKECFICGKFFDEKYANIHHKTYKRLGKEKLCNLVAICGGCHREVHFIKDLKLRNNADTLNQRVYKLRADKRQLSELN